MSESNKNLEKYLKDIDTIKGMLFESEKRPLYEHWVFYAWGILVLIGTVVHYFIVLSGNLSVAQIFVRVWLPLILLAGFLQLVAFIRSLNKQELSFFSRALIKFYLNVLGYTVVICFLVLLFIRVRAISHLPVVFLLASSVYFFIFAQASYDFMYVHGYLMVFLALVLYLLRIDFKNLQLITGCIVGVALITCGIVSAVKEQKQNE